SVFAAAFDELLSYLLLTRNDFTFRDDYTDRDSFRLAIVDSLMLRPLDMMAFVDTTARRFADFGADHRKIFPYLAALFGPGKSVAQTGGVGAIPQKDNSGDIKIKNLPGRLHEPIQRACGILFDMQETLKQQMGGDWNSERNRFIAGQFKELLLEDVTDDTKSAETMDSLQRLEEQYAIRFSKTAVDLSHIPLLASLTSDTVDIFRQIDRIYTLLTTDEQLKKKAESGKPLLDMDSPYGRIVVGGDGPDTYRGDYFIIIDPGGDDNYYLTYDIAHPHPTLIVDCAGNDYYKAESDFAIASGAFSNSFLVDYAGDDNYIGSNFSVASGYFGSGILWDKKGDDHYFGDTFTQGAGTFGLGLLIDDDGADTYTGSLYCQGFGFVRGIGGIIDYHGNDTYTVQSKYKDILRYDDHYISLSQGFAYGIRPVLSGGYGFICDYAGNDVYVSDIFGQGSGYWWSLGMIYDRSGNDQYISFQYAQGAGAHMALGILLDEAGGDVYRAHGVSQGCGHDYSCGWLLDRGGEDVYSSAGLSQGAGSANGFGIITDIGGDDGYYIFVKGNCQGYGNPRRDYGSIGLFLDLDGADHYDGNGTNNRFWRTASKWGGGMDREILPAKVGEAK
ncbi:MAG: hypothetical protein PHR28_11655, partial [candidate division Zixibacteria bacterium]|nr:hypothetical protein [candidate division Zixibacteria bacterium]